MPTTQKCKKCRAEMETAVVNVLETLMPEDPQSGTGRVRIRIVSYCPKCDPEPRRLVRELPQD